MDCTRKPPVGFRRGESYCLAILGEEAEMTIVDVKRIGTGLLTSVIILLLLDLLPTLVPDQYVAY